MSDPSNTARLPPVNEKLRDDFRQFVMDTQGTVRGHYKKQVENALHEYINAYQGGDTHDRLTRIENEVNDIKTMLSERELEGGNDSISNTTEQRISEIMTDIQDHAEDIGSKRVTEDVVKSAIEKNAGHSFKTIQRYKELLQNQKALFQHPENESVFFVNPEAFIVFCEQNLSEGEITRLYDVFGDSWWSDNAPDGFLESDAGKGFQ